MVDMIDRVVFRPKCFQMDRNDRCQLYNPSASLDCKAGIFCVQHLMATWQTTADHRGKCVAPPIDTSQAYCFFHHMLSEPEKLQNPKKKSLSIVSAFSTSVKSLLQNSHFGCMGVVCDIFRCPAKRMKSWRHIEYTEWPLCLNKSQLGNLGTDESVGPVREFHYDRECNPSKRLDQPRRWLRSIWWVAVSSDDDQKYPSPSIGVRWVQPEAEWTCSSAICLLPWPLASGFHHHHSTRFGKVHSEPVHVGRKKETKRLKIYEKKKNLQSKSKDTWNSKIVSSSGYWYV